MGQNPVTWEPSLEDAVEDARFAERRRIARQLHGGILQELTVVGLQLRALHAQVPPDNRPAVSELADWLEIRQAELRQLVAELHGESALHGDFTAIVERATAEWGCAVTLDIQPAGAKVDAIFRMAVRTVLAELVRTIAAELGGQHVSAVLTLEPLPALTIRHDGAPPAPPRLDIDRLRRFIGSSGAALRIGTPAGATDMVVDWNA